MALPFYKYLSAFVCIPPVRVTPSCNSNAAVIKIRVVHCSAQKVGSLQNFRTQLKPDMHILQVIYRNFPMLVCDSLAHISYINSQPIPN